MGLVVPIMVAANSISCVRCNRFDQPGIATAAALALHSRRAARLGIGGRRTRDIKQDALLLAGKIRRCRSDLRLAAVRGELSRRYRSFTSKNTSRNCRAPKRQRAARPRRPPSPRSREADFATLLASADAGAGEKNVRPSARPAMRSIPRAATRSDPICITSSAERSPVTKDFAYSEALKGKDGKWSYDHLNHFLENPKSVRAGNQDELRRPEQGQGPCRGDRLSARATPNPRRRCPSRRRRPRSRRQRRQKRRRGAGDPRQASRPPREGPAGAPAAAAAAGGARCAAAGAAGATDDRRGRSAEGEKVFRKCQACHNAEKGGPNKVGPHL